MLDIDDEHVGVMVEAMQARKAELVNMDVSKQGPSKTRIEYTVLHSVPATFRVPEHR